MGVLHLLGTAGEGGAETYFVDLVTALKRAGVSEAAAMRANPTREQRLKAAGVPVKVLRFGGPLDILTRPATAGFAALNKTKVALAWMNRAARHTPRGPWARIGRLGGYYSLKYYKGFDHLVANTQDLVRWITAQGWPAARVHHLPNFADDLHGMAPAPLPGAAPRVLALGRLHRNKGFDLLIRAVALLPRATLVIAGEGPERAALEAMAREAGVADRTHLIGWRSDPGALLAACDVFCASSRHEPLGNMVLEAWSAGRPVVAAAAQGPSELIRDGETGLLVPPESPEALARGIAAVLADPARAGALAAAGRAEYARAHAQGPVLARWRETLHAIAATKENA